MQNLWFAPVFQLRLSFVPSRKPLTVWLKRGRPVSRWNNRTPNDHESKLGCASRALVAVDRIGAFLPPMSSRSSGGAHATLCLLPAGMPIRTVASKSISCHCSRHCIEWLYISMNEAIHVQELKCLSKLAHDVPDIQYATCFPGQVVVSDCIIEDTLP